MSHPCQKHALRRDHRSSTSARISHFMKGARVNIARAPRPEIVNIKGALFCRLFSFYDTSLFYEPFPRESAGVGFAFRAEQKAEAGQHPALSAVARPSSPTSGLGCCVLRHAAAERGLCLSHIYTVYIYFSSLPFTGQRLRPSSGEVHPSSKDERLKIDPNSFRGLLGYVEQ